MELGGKDLFEKIWDEYESNCCSCCGESLWDGFRRSLHRIESGVSSLQHLRTKGLVHLDIKPENFVVLRNGVADEDGILKMIDFDGMYNCKDDIENCVDDGSFSHRIVWTHKYGSLHRNLNFFHRSKSSKVAISAYNEDLWALLVTSFNMLYLVIPGLGDKEIDFLQDKDFKHNERRTINGLQSPSQDYSKFIESRWDFLSDHTEGIIPKAKETIIFFKEIMLDLHKHPTEAFDLNKIKQFFVDIGPLIRAPLLAGVGPRSISNCFIL